MAKVIELCARPFRKKMKWVPLEQRGKVLAFPEPVKKTA